MGKPVRILLHGVTGRMGSKRHLHGALLPLIAAGANLELTIAGRDLTKLSELAQEADLEVVSDVEAAISRGGFDLFFDASNPLRRPELLELALCNSIGIYGEKPISLNTGDIRRLAEIAREKQLFAGVVQDKLYTRGYRAMKRALNENLLGEVFDISGDFGYWIETGLDGKPLNRPSWNYKRKEGGSLIPDLYSHWNYIVEMVDEITWVSALTATHVKTRAEVSGEKFLVDVPDTAHVILETKNGITGRISSSWVQRPLVPFTTRISGSKASLVTTPDSCSLITSDSEVNLIERFALEKEDEFLLQWQDVLGAINNPLKINFDLGTALRQGYLCDAIVQSAVSGSRTKIYKERT